MTSQVVYETDCDRCGVVNRSTQKGRPVGWSVMSISGGAYTCQDRDLCGPCAQQVADVLGGDTLVHVGYYRQAGSGKVFHEMFQQEHDPATDPKTHRVYAKSRAALPANRKRS